jgi:hypothetical protein
MKNIQPKQPSHLSPYALACLDALVKANLADRISLGGALGLFHYLFHPWWAKTALAQNMDFARLSFAVAGSKVIVK